MIKYYLLVAVIFIQLNLQAQSVSPAGYEIEEEYNWWNLNINDNATVFADIAYIREKPDFKSQLLDSLKNGSIVKILSKGYNTTTIRGFSAPWYRILYQSNGVNKEGFIWLGLLALGKETNPKGEVFIHGFLRKNNIESENTSYLLEIKHLNKEGNLAARANYPADLFEQSYTESKVLNNMGLDGLESIHRIAFLGEACGISSNYYYFGWNGKDIIPMFDKTTVSDAGIYYYEEKILFPSEHHLDKNLIIKDIETGEAIDPDSNEINYKVSKERKKFNWDGKAITEIPKNN